MILDFDTRLALVAGVDIPIPSLKIAVHQPTIKEIAMISEDSFFKAASYLTVNKNRYVKDEALLEQTTNFQIFMTVLHDSERRDGFYSVMSLLTLLLPEYKVSITPQSIILDPNAGGDMIIIDESNFEPFQEVVKDITGVKSGGGGSSTDEFNPANAAAKAIAEKLQKGREKIAQENTTNGSVLSRYTSIIAIGLQLSLLDIMDMTVKQVYDLMERLKRYIGWDMHNRTCLAGGKPDGSPEDWMGDLYNS